MEVEEMINEELVAGLRHIAHTMERNGHSYYQHVAEEAIKALEQQTCENINEDYADCDQFKCSECQIELQDWHRVERDDDGEVSYHEYTFRYCPHCGRRIKYDE